MNEMNVFGATLLLPFLLPAGAASPPATPPSSPSLPAFELRDQDGNTVRGEDLLGRAVLVVGADRGGRDQTARWARALRTALAERATPDVVLLRVADLTAVPPPARPLARRFVRDRYDVPLLLDFGGEIADRFDFAPGLANVLVFDANGRLVEHRIGTVPAPAELDALLRRLLDPAEEGRP